MYLKTAIILAVFGGFYLLLVFVAGRLSPRPGRAAEQDLSFLASWPGPRRSRQPGRSYPVPMGGRVDPPDGTPEGGPNGGDDEYRSLVFDESFIKAARLQEFSAQERLQDEEHAAVRPRPEAEHRGPRVGLGLSRQGLILVLLIALAFGTAIYMGIRNPYRSPGRTGAEPLHSEVLPLAPTEPVPGSNPADLFANSPAARFATGADGVALPPVRSSGRFSESQVLAALTAAKDYVVESSLDPDVLTGGAVRPVRVLLDPRQQRQFDQSGTMRSQRLRNPP